MVDSVTNTEASEHATQAKPDEKRPSRLGRGLSSLMGSAVPVSPPVSRPPAVSSESIIPPDVPRGTTDPIVSKASDTESTDVPHGTSLNTSRTYDTHAEFELVWLDLNQVSPNPHQPRTQFDQEKLQELAESIGVHGVMQPVVVRPRPSVLESDREAGGYELIAGERRWRAAQLAGLPALPAVIRDLDDQASAELALVENLQREDLNPMERAEALQVLSTDFGLTHEQIGVKVGLKRSSVTNLLRLLELTPSLQGKVAAGDLSMGHARALLGADSKSIQDRAAELIDRLDGFTVRQAEELIRYENALALGDAAGELEPPMWHPDAEGVRDVSHGTSSTAQVGSTNGGAGGAVKSDWIADLERQMSQSLTTKVSIRPGRKNGTGRVTIDYHSLEDFDVLLEKLGVKPE